MAVYCIYKKRKLTSYQAIAKFRHDMKFDKTIKLGYAGRLDPMAEGLFLVLEGEDNKRQKDFFDLDKEYIAEVVFGISTDSGDVLGLVDNNLVNMDFSLANLKEAIKKYTGVIDQKVSNYSAVRVAGKPLFWWAKNNRLIDIEVPVYKRNINSIEVVELSTINSQELEKHIIDSLLDISGHFRQDEILECWKVFFENNPSFVLNKIKFKISCSSGTFMRQLFEDIGRDLGYGAVLISLLRTRIGNYTIEDIDYNF